MNSIESNLPYMDQRDTPSRLLTKIIASLISAAIVPSIAILCIILMFLLAGATYSATFESQKFDFSATGSSGIIDSIKLLVGVTFFLGAYIIPFVFLCVGTLGFPVAFAGWRLGLIRSWTCTLAGFFLSSVPGGLFLYNSYSGGSSSANGIQYWINATPTLAGIIQFAIIVLTLGLLGAIGGYSFWQVWRFLTRYL